MQLHEVFAQGGDTAPLTKAVKFRVANPARDSKSPPPRSVEIGAVFVLVDEPETAASIRDAEAAIRVSYRDADGAPIPIPDEARASERVYHFLLRALRDESDPRKPLARTIVELRRAVDPITARRLITAYNEWADAENPDTITAAALEKLKEQAAGESERAGT